jgi:hypothetical protein
MKLDQKRLWIHVRNENWPETWLIRVRDEKYTNTE